MHAYTNATGVSHTHPVGRAWGVHGVSMSVHTHRQFIGRVWVHMGCKERSGCGSVLGLCALGSCNVPLRVYAYVHLQVLCVCRVGQRDTWRGDVDGCLMCSGMHGGSQPWHMRHIPCAHMGMCRSVCDMQVGVHKDMACCRGHAWWCNWWGCRRGCVSACGLL